MIQTSISVVTRLETSCFRPHHPTMDSDMTQLYAYLATLVVFVVCDMAWLGTMASRLYRPTLGDVLLANVNLPPAIAFYLIYPAGLVVFAVLPALRSGNLSQAAISGALLFDLRPYQPGHVAELDAAADGPRYHLGYRARRHLRDRSLPHHRQASVVTTASGVEGMVGSAPARRGIGRRASAACAAPVAGYRRHGRAPNTCRPEPAKR